MGGVDASGKFPADSPGDGPDGVSEGDAGDADAGPAGCGVRRRGLRSFVSRRWPTPVSPGQLALVSVLQFAENLSDRAPDAVRTRIDWKYGLVLELDDPGFDHSLLSEFRSRLAEGGRADQLLQVMLDCLVAAGLLKGRGRQRTDATHVLAAVESAGAGGASVRAARDRSGLAGAADRISLGHSGHTAP
ncbi:transposase [Streptomyces phaeochromogenes]|uniref:transposase n=1 Tax=Streptomyces phaeochromogenes TaxID=1923 RepID=UPI00398D13C8